MDSICIRLGALRGSDRSAREVRHKKTDSDVATAVRTVIVLIFSWLLVWIVDSASTITEIGTRSWIFLVLSGMATGASWLCYFRALGLGDVNKVVPIDKSSTVLTILLALIFLGEQITWIKAVAVVLIGVGTFLMIEKKEEYRGKGPAQGLAYLCCPVSRICEPDLYTRKGGDRWC